MRDRELHEPIDDFPRPISEYQARKMGQLGINEKVRLMVYDPDIEEATICYVYPDDVETFSSRLEARGYMVREAPNESQR